MKKMVKILGVSLVTLGLLGAFGAVETGAHAASAHALAPKVACSGQVAVLMEDSQGNTTSATCLVQGNSRYFNNFSQVCNHYGNTSNIAAEIDMNGNQEFVSPGSCFTNTIGSSATIQVVSNN